MLLKIRAIAKESHLTYYLKMKANLNQKPKNNQNRKQTKKRSNCNFKTWVLISALPLAALHSFPACFPHVKMGRVLVYTLLGLIGKK